MYDTWYSYKEQIIDIYSNQKLVRVPLSQNKDFKTIKNAIIKAAANLSIEPIDEKEYDTELLARGIKKERIRHYGFAFRGKKVLIGTEE